jgi:hypothetical protein
MQDQNELNPVERELERALRTLSPAAARIDPVAAAFAAGQVAGSRAVRLWQSAAVLMLAVGAAGWLVRSGREIVDSRETTSPTVAIVTEKLPAGTLSAHSVLRLQQAVREGGLEGLPTVYLPRVEILRPGVDLDNYRGET